MRRQARWGMLLLLGLLIAAGGWFVSITSSARPASVPLRAPARATTRAAAPASRITGACPVRHHRSSPCCPPPPAHARAGASRCLGIATAPNPSTDPQAVTIAGRLFGPRHAHAVVLLWRRLPGQRRFHITAATRTDRIGDYSLAVHVDANRWWYTSARGFRSRTVHQRVAALITLASSETRAAPGDQVSFTGNVAPSHAGQSLVLQELGPSGWQAAAQGTLDGASTFSTTYSFATL